MSVSCGHVGDQIKTQESIEEVEERVLFGHVLEAGLRVMRTNDIERKLEGYITPFGLPTESFPEHSRFELWPRFMNFLNEEEEVRVLGLLGRSGGGKSLFSGLVLRNLLKTWSEEEKYNSKSRWLPVYVQLRKYKEAPTQCIEDCLRQDYHLSAGQIELLKKESTPSGSKGHNSRVLFILDGHDELGSANNGVQICQQLHKFQKTSKLVVLGRSEQFSLENTVEQAFQFGENSSSEVRVIYLSPFNKTEIQQFCEQFDKSKGNKKNEEEENMNETEEKKEKTCFEQVSQVSGLLELVSNPFTLSIVLQSFDKLVNNRNSQRRRFGVVRFEIYEAFIEHWFEKESLGSDFVKEKLTMLNERVAREMFERGMVSIRKPELIKKNTDDHSQESVSRESWIFDEENSSMFEISPVKKTGEDLSFVHKSILEFLVARALIKELKERVNTRLWDKKDLVRDERSVMLFMSDFVRLERELEGLNCWWVPKNGEVDNPKSNGSLQERLVELVFATRNGVNGFCGANAISVLNYSQFSFSGMDFSNTKIVGADLQNSILENVNLKGAMLSGNVCGRETVSRFESSWLDRAILDGSVFGIKRTSADQKEEVLCCEFGEFPALLGHSSTVQGVAFSPDGSKIVSCSPYDSIRIWDTKSYHCDKKIRKNEHSYDKICCVAISPDGTKMVSGSEDQTIGIWDFKTGHCDQVVKPESKTGSVMCVGFSSDGSKIVAGYEDGSIRIWLPQTEECEKTLTGHSDQVRGVCFSPDDSKIVSGSRDTTIRIWDPKTGECENTLKGHWGRTVSCSPDGSKIVSGSLDGGIWLWDLKSGECEKKIHGHTEAVNSVVFSPDGKKLISVSEDRSVRIWDTQTGECQNIFKEIDSINGSIVGAVAISPDGSKIVSHYDRTIRIWNPKTRVCEKPSPGHSGGVNSVSFSSNGSEIVCGFEDKSVGLWDTNTGQCVKILRGHTEIVKSVGFSSDATKVVSGSEDLTIRMWDKKTGTCDFVFEGHTKPVCCVAFSSDGSKIASGSADETIRIWDTKTGQCEKILKGHSDRVNCLVFSADGSRMVSGSEDDTIRIWDTKTGESTSTGQENPPGWGVTCVALSPDGLKIISSSHSTSFIRIWNATTAECEMMLDGHRPSVVSLCFSWDGSKILSGSEDETIRVWDAKTGHCDEVMEGQFGNILSISFSPDASKICSGSADQTVRVREIHRHKDGLLMDRLLWKSGPVELSCRGVSAKGIVDPKEEVMMLLVQRGADDVWDDDLKYPINDPLTGNTPLHQLSSKMTTKAESLEWLTKWIERLGVNVCNFNDETPLMMASENGNLDVCKTLIENRAEVNLVTKEGKTALLNLCALSKTYFNNSTHGKIVELLLQSKADPSMKDPSDRTPLQRASKSGNIEVVRQLIHAKVDVNVPACDGSTALINACYNGHEEILDLLVEAGADVNHTTRTGETPLKRAIYGDALNSSKVRMCQKLIEFKADVNQPPNEVKPLFVAAGYGITDICRLLIENNADIHELNQYRVGPLLMAVTELRTDAIKFMIELKVDVNVRDECNRAPLDVVLKMTKKYPEARVIADLLRAHGAVQTPPENGDN